MAEVANYSITFHNRTNPTTDTWKFCLYQKVPDTSAPDILALAWQVKPCAYGNDLMISWTETYAFQWSQSGNLKDGAKFVSSGTLACVPGDASSNSTQLTKVGDTYHFEKYGIHPSGDNLLIHSGQNIDASVSVGIAMGGKSAFATQANSNVDHLFIPKPTYYATFGVYEQGTVIDHQASVNPFKIEFMGYHNIELTLNSNFDWTTKTLEKANEERISQTERARAIERAAIGL